jgi:hypothetical protein
MQRAAVTGMSVVVGAATLRPAAARRSVIPVLVLGFSKRIFINEALYLSAEHDSSTSIGPLALHMDKIHRIDTLGCSHFDITVVAHSAMGGLCLKRVAMQVCSP